MNYDRTKAFDGYMVSYPDNPFLPYKDIHSGMSCIFYGSGPTILDFKKEKVPDDFLQFGTNDQIFLGLDLDYWFMGDSMCQIPKKFYDRFEQYNEYQPKKQKFVRYCNWKDDRKITVPGWGSVPRSGQLPLNMKNSKYYVSDSGGNPDTCLFEKEISTQNMNSVASISFEVLQFILYTGVKEIFLVGHDCDYSRGTFAKIMIGREQQAGYYISRYWRIVSAWITKNYPDVKIHSVQPVALDCFPPTTRFS
tara:strand:+ start:644 stop:1393 length:750 start_codon:yes stop_codon:yes gene_type:complete